MKYNKCFLNRAVVLVSREIMQFFCWLTFLIVPVLGWEMEPVIDCWEECFHEGDFQDQEAYQDFFQLAHYVKMRRILENANGTFYILDSNLVEKSDVDYFRYLKDIIRLLAIVSPSGQKVNPFHLAQFNQDFAWSCDSWHGLGRCEAINQLNNFVELVDPKRNGLNIGKINDACGVLSRQIAQEEDEDDFKIHMAIMLISHEFGFDDDQHSDLPHCSTTFPSRIGILTGKGDELEISSFTKQTKTIKHDEYHATSLAKLTQCMQDSCCTEENAKPPNSCIKSSPAAKKTEKYSTF